MPNDNDVTPTAVGHARLRDTMAFAWTGLPYGPGNENSVDAILDALEQAGYVIVESFGSDENDLDTALRDWLASTRAPSGAFGQSMENTMAYESIRRLRYAAAKHLSGGTDGTS